MVKLLMISQPRKRTCLRLIYLVLLVMAILFGASLLWNKSVALLGLSADQCPDILQLHRHEEIHHQQQQQCHLRQYLFASRNVVSCLDSVKSRSWLHFAFIGDSRIRQQFYNFLKMIPDDDRHIYPRVDQDSLAPIHQDVTVTSRLLNLIVSFRWRPLIDVHVTRDIAQWLETASTTLLQFPDANYPPDFILISIAAHHMLKENGASYQEYENSLRDIEPILSKLAISNLNTTSDLIRRKVVWLNQFPTVDSFSGNDEDNTDIFRDKVHKYSLIVRRVFRNSKVVIWDSGALLAEEYVRACHIVKRNEFHYRRDWLDAFYNCDDYIHTGYSALSQITQILLNAICYYEN